MSVNKWQQRIWAQKSIDKPIVCGAGHCYVLLDHWTPGSKHHASVTCKVLTHKLGICLESRRKSETWGTGLKPDKNTNSPAPKISVRARKTGSTVKGQLMWKPRLQSYKQNGSLRFGWAWGARGSLELLPVETDPSPPTPCSVSGTEIEAERDSPRLDTPRGLAALVISLSP